LSSAGHFPPDDFSFFPGSGRLRGLPTSLETFDFFRDFFLEPCIFFGNIFDIRIDRPADSNPYDLLRPPAGLFFLFFLFFREDFFFWFDCPWLSWRLPPTSILKLDRYGPTKISLTFSALFFLWDAPPADATPLFERFFLHLDLPGCFSPPFFPAFAEARASISRPVCHEFSEGLLSSPLYLPLAMRFPRDTFAIENIARPFCVMSFPPLRVLETLVPGISHPLFLFSINFRPEFPPSPSQVRASPRPLEYPKFSDLRAFPSRRGRLPVPSSPWASDF